MRTYALLLLAALVACTPKQSTELVESQAINGITESIEEPITNPDKDFVAEGLSKRGPVNIGAFQTTAAQEARIDSLLEVMTIEEKAGQMNQYTSFYDLTGPPPTGGSAQERFEQVRKGLVGSMLNVTGAANTRKIQELAMQSRLKIPIIFGFDVIHGFKTQFPVPLAEAASFNLDLIEQGARWAAVEASAHGINWTFAPMVDVSPDARWGRIVEGAGEDPYYGSLVAAARVRGFQGAHLADKTSIATCTKHFAGYGYAEGGRDYNAVDVSDYTLYNDILPPFEAAARAGSATFMNGFNTMAGLPVTGSRSLQRDWLKDQLGWPGFVVSDWNSIGEMVDHGAVADRRAAAELALEAGSDMDMEATAYISAIPDLVRAGELDQSLVDDAVRRILRVKFALGLFENPFKNCDIAAERAVAGNEELREASIAAAAASAVLLKNEPVAGRRLLPLSPTSTRKLVVIGDLATHRDSPQGTWSLGAERGAAATLVDGLRANVDDAVRLTTVAGPPTLRKDSKEDFLYEVFPNTSDRSGMEEAVRAAAAADVVVLALGEPGFMSGEARSRTDITLPGLQQELFERVYAANPQVVVVLYTGRPLAIESLASKAPAILLAWQPGTFGNYGIAQVLFGEHNPSGKLPVSFPYTVGQEPLTYREYATGRPGFAGRPDGSEMVFVSHYMDAPRGALFPFGHGLSYTEFELSGLSAKPTSTGGISATVTVSNTGERVGTETVQLYLHDPVASRVRPLKELKGFRQLSLKPGESQSITFQLTPKQLEFWTPEQGWHLEPGTFRIMVGTSSAATTDAVEVEVK